MVCALHQLSREVYPVRCIVLSMLPKTPHNAVLQLFSGQREGVHYGNRHIHWKTGMVTTLLDRLLKKYREEGLSVYTMDDFVKESTDEIIAELTPRQVSQLSSDQLSGLSPEKRLSGLSDREVLKTLFPTLSEPEITEMLKKNGGA